MARYRVTVWLKDQPSIRVSKQYSKLSLHDACAHAVKLIVEVKEAHQLTPDKVGFTVEYLAAGLQGWEVKYSSESRAWQEMLARGK